MKIRMEQGRLISNNLKAERGYRNPSFLQKMVEHHEIDQYGSAFSKDVFDPHGLHDEVIPSRGVLYTHNRATWWWAPVAGIMESRAFEHEGMAHSAGAPDACVRTGQKWQS